MKPFSNTTNQNQVKFTGRRRRLEDALQVFDVTTMNCLEETKLRKRYKNLSLLHHPDRNNNSQESVERMQVINGHYNLLLMELRRRSSKEQQESSSSDYDDDDYDDHHDQEQQQENHKKQKQQRKISKRGKRRNEERFQEEQKQRELEEINRIEKEYKQKRKEEQRETRKSILRYQKLGLDSPKNRDKAHAKFLEQKRLYKQAMVAATTTTTTRGEGGRSKNLILKLPINLIMEYSNHKLSIAIRMGKIDIALKLFSDSLHAATKKWHMYKLNSVLSSPTWSQQHGQGRKRKSLLQLDIDESLRDLVLKSTLLNPLDHDGNTVLHYAVYFRRVELLNCYVKEARRWERFTESILSRNNRGETALDFVFDYNDISSQTIYELWKEAMTEHQQAREQMACKSFSEKAVQYVNSTMLILGSLMIGALVVFGTSRRGFISIGLMSFCRLMVYPACNAIWRLRGRL